MNLDRGAVVVAGATASEAAAVETVLAVVAVVAAEATGAENPAGRKPVNSNNNGQAEAPVPHLAALYGSRGSVAKHFGNALHNFRGVVAYTDDRIGAQFTGMLEHALKGVFARLLA